MFQVVARLKLNKIKAVQSGTLFVSPISALYKVSLFGSIQNSPLSTTAANAGTVGIKVATTDDFGSENDVSLDLLSKLTADNDFAVGMIQAGASVPITWAVAMTAKFPSDCYFTLYAVLEQDVIAVNSL